MKDRFFNKENPTYPGETGDQMLRSLINKVPTQMRKANKFLEFRRRIIHLSRVYHL
jgi:hypothetical protein